MKRKTWIVSALMYALVFLVCFGVLHVFKKITTAGDSTEYTSKAAAETNIVIDGSPNVTELKVLEEKTGKRLISKGGVQNSLKDQICQKIQMNYGMRRRKIPISDGKQAIKAGVRHCLRFGRRSRKKSIIRLQGSSRQRMFIIRAQIQRMTEQLFSFL